MQDWILRTNIYEVNLRQYTSEGTINAFAAHLPRLKNMGVETLWFMPLTPISQLNKKGSMGSYYACSDYTSVALEFGSLGDFKTLVFQAHKLGMKVILDWVANHTGWDHWWTVEHPDWYEKDDQSGSFKKASGMDDIIELDFKNAAMRRAMIDAMKFWVSETDIDGFRCDLAFWVELDFWLEAKPTLEKLKPLFWLAELDPLDNADYLQVFDAAYTWMWMHTAERFYKGQASFAELLQVLDQYNTAPGLKAWFTSNHDENSWNGTEYEKYGDLAPLLAVFSCTWPGVPLLYSGQELPNHKRLQFFEKDVIEWSEAPALDSFYKKLLALKSQSPALAANASLEIINADRERQLLVFRRRKDDSEITVVLNFSGEEKDFFLPEGSRPLRDVLNGESIENTNGFVLQLPPRGYRIFAG